MKKLIPILLLSLLLTGCAAPPSSGEGYRQIAMSEAAVLMEEEQGYVLLDVRRPDEFASGHIPGAINLPNEIIGTKRPAELPDLDQLILVYCRSGNRSKDASRKLVALGYTNVVEIGGILDWKGETERGE